MHDTIHRLTARIGDMNVSTVLIILTLLLVVAGGAVTAQEMDEQTFEDDFEDGDVNGWVHVESGVTPSASPVSVAGNVSLNTTTGGFVGDTATVEWTSGPTLNTSEGFAASGVFRPEWQSGGGGIRLGIAGPSQDTAGQNAFLVFQPDGTFLATASGQGGSGAETIRPFSGTWVNFRMESDEGSTTIRSKVWEYGTPEPLDWQLTRSDFDDVQPGNFGVNPGSNEPTGERRAYLDEVRIRGTPVPEPESSDRLTLDAPPLIQHGETEGYEVRYVGENNRTSTVTSEANVTSQDASIITVNPDGTLTATSDENVTQRVTIDAEYQGEVTSAEVAVAEPTVQNMEVLPTLWRFNALMSDGTVFALIICTLFSVIATWIATPFAGIGAMELAVLIGWSGGWIPLGIMLVSVFAALFIGFNLAANIDYAVTG